MLAIELRLQEIAPILQDSLLKNKKEGTVTASVVCLDDGRSFLSISNSRDFTPPVHISEEIRHLFADPHTIHEFTDQQGVHVVGIASPLQESNWGLIIAENYDDVYAKLISSRNRNIVIALVFTLIISLIAYYFSARIITPLTTLINGAQKVAGGDLEVRLPIYSKDELGLTTQVFNEMVAELQLSHNKLKELATIDSLTKLVNQKEVTKILLDHLHHYQRYSTVFSILMIDVDFFKNINDTYGHLAGDAVLEQLAKIFTDTLRDVDYPGRYGGEEFLVVLSQTNGEEARICAERVRKEVNKHTFTYDDLALNLSVSIGVATVTDQDKDESSLIRRADDALYKAKAGGRDQVV